jgi:hypothetical protein
MPRALWPLWRGKPRIEVVLDGRETIRNLIPQPGFDHNVSDVGVPNTPPNFDGIAGFRFLSRFTYGNFGLRNQFESVSETIRQPLPTVYARFGPRGGQIAPIVFALSPKSVSRLLDWTQ